MNYPRILYPVILVLVFTACSQSPTTSLETQILETQKLTALEGDVTGIRFGSAVAVDGDFMVVGASGLDTLTSNPYQDAVYLYQRDVTGSWQFLKKLLSSDGAASDRFGFSVAISGNTIVVGAQEADLGANVDQGSAYIFERDHGGANSWGQIKKLVVSDGAAFDYFGYSVAISGNTVVVGASFDDIGSKSNQGSAYIFYRNRGGTNTWGRVKKLIASDGAISDYFGFSVAISGNTVVVGASFDFVGANNLQGSAYLFERDQGSLNNWGETKKLLASDGVAYDYFGYSVAINGNTIVVGAVYGDTNYAQGAAYVFERDLGSANNWSEIKKLRASDGGPTDYFGSSVAISNNTIIVGAPYYRGSDTGIAYLFSRNRGGPNVWEQARKLVASDRTRSDSLGYSVAVSGNTVVAGTPGDNNSQGSAYIFR